MCKKSAGRTKKTKIHSSKQTLSQEPSTRQESILKKESSIVDPGASAHMMSKSDLNHEEKATILKSNEAVHDYYSEWLSAPGLVARDSGAGEPIPKTPPSTSSSKTVEQIWRENTIHSHISRRAPDVKYAKRTKITRVPCRRNPESREDTQIGDTITADRTKGCSARFGYAMDTESSVQTQDCTRHDEKIAAILTSRKQSWSDLH